MKKFKFTMAGLFALASSAAFAGNGSVSVSPQEAKAIEQNREGDLKKTVIERFALTHSLECKDEQNPVFEAIKLGAVSEKQIEHPDTHFAYYATYLVIERCYSATKTPGTADTLTKRASLVNATFYSKADENGGPEKMEGLEIKVKKDVHIDKGSEE